MNPARWRRWALRHARLLTGLLVALWVLSVFAALDGPLARPGLTGTLLLIVLLMLWSVWVRWQRERAVREAPLPQFLKRKLRETYPHLSGKDCDLVERGLRQFFLAMPAQPAEVRGHALEGGRRDVARVHPAHPRLPRVVLTCTLGGFLHHTPAEALGARGQGQRRPAARLVLGVPRRVDQPARSRRACRCCSRSTPSWSIEGGFRYQPDCRDIRRKSDQGGDGSGGTLLRHRLLRRLAQRRCRMAWAAMDGSARRGRRWRRVCGAEATEAPASQPKVADVVQRLRHLDVEGRIARHLE